ncbi:hypothetical protein SCHPADRAFT_121709 [Schizopora paradoxa]|uniref:Secreted protein n=1 Tax=Schizopora paradoxa TaxID=27342 RepID=A0A0H2S1X9_9AGAM|nr:hypothetical protein SCHPADRAFT_121709 [Schizopora paradoxa]
MVFHIFVCTCILASGAFCARHSFVVVLNARQNVQHVLRCRALEFRKRGHPVFLGTLQVVEMSPGFEEEEHACTVQMLATPIVAPRKERANNAWQCVVTNRTDHTFSSQTARMPFKILPSVVRRMAPSPSPLIPYLFLKFRVELVILEPAVPSVLQDICLRLCRDVPLVRIHDKIKDIQLLQSTPSEAVVVDLASRHHSPAMIECDRDGLWLLFCLSAKLRHKTRKETRSYLICSSGSVCVFSLPFIVVVVLLLLTYGPRFACSAVLLVVRNGCFGFWATGCCS